MSRSSLAGQRRWFGVGLIGLAASTFYWNFCWDGMPVIWGPSANAAEIAAGRELFEHQWTANDPLASGDGVGPVFNAQSCAACHFQGGLGGGGALQHNATSYEVFPRRGDSTLITGTIHNFSVDPAHRESLDQLKQLYPVVPGRTISSGRPECPTVVNVPSFDPVHTDSVQATALFGAGWIDLISEKAIRHNQQKRMAKNTIRELNLEFDAIPVGRLRTLSDGSVGKFGWKAQFASLRSFVSAACANELGLGTPDTEQAKPIGAPDYTAAVPDLNRKQLRALVSFVKTLPRPVEIAPERAADEQTAARGKALFSSIGCAVCHVPDIGGVKGIYTDFLLYTLEDPLPAGGGTGSYSPPPPLLELPARPDNEPKPSEWKTPALWGVADSAPYMHDGSASTLQDAIGMHRGDAKAVSEADAKLTAGDQAALIAFLKTLRAPPEAEPLSDPSATKLAKK